MNFSPNIGLYGSYSSPSVEQAPGAPAPATARQATVAQPVQTPVDTVHISQGAQAQSLAQQGQSPSQIANSLGLPVSMVDTDLGITPTGSVAVTVPATAMKAPPTAI